MDCSAFSYPSSLKYDPYVHRSPVFAYVLQIIVAANHMSGKDTHVRGLRILGPIEENTRDDDPFVFRTPTFRIYEQLR